MSKHKQTTQPSFGKNRSSRASLPEIPLPPVFSGMSLNNALQKQQFEAERADLEQYYQDIGIMQWQEGYDIGEQAAEKTLAQGLARGYEAGHAVGWKESADLNFQNSINNGFTMGAKMLIAGDNFNIVDKNDLGNVLSAPTLDELIAKIPAEGQLNHFRPNEDGWFSKSELYSRNSSFIRSADGNLTYLDVARLCNRMQNPEHGRMIKGKYFEPAAEEHTYELKPTVEDFDMLMGSIMKPAPSNKYIMPTQSRMKTWAGTTLLEYKK